MVNAVTRETRLSYPAIVPPGGWGLLVFLLNPIWDREEALLSSESEGACERVDTANTMPFSPHSILQVNVRFIAPGSTKISEKIGGSELAESLSGFGFGRFRRACREVFRLLSGLNHSN